MNRNKILLTVLAIISLAFIGLLALLLNRPGALLNQTLNQTKNVSMVEKPQLVHLKLDPNVVSTNSGELINLTIRFENVKSGVEATDLVVNYDPSMLEFVEVDSLNPNFTNPRKLAEKNRLVLSFVNEGTSIETDDLPGSVTMAKLVFRATRSGKSQIVPDLTNEISGSIVMTEENFDNQLTSANSVEITVR